MPRYFSNYDDWKLSTPEDDMDEWDEFEEGEEPEERDPDAERQQAEDDRMDREQDR